ncbi:hypothetical protein Lalb_Chr23g0266981 [Lupinus albus]|uniref:Uncharacterized protein n=1 Tax=Lupinus albus TaxID=3870 RepID=A0A6A4MTX3_LUPAL|nr:hypothetical protein Lalb_Chr23g0266981 [Lupinus albus]
MKITHWVLLLKTRTCNERIVPSELLQGICIYWDAVVALHCGLLAYLKGKRHIKMA